MRERHWATLPYTILSRCWTLLCKCGPRVEFFESNWERLPITCQDFLVLGAGAESVWRPSDMKPLPKPTANFEPMPQRQQNRGVWTEHNIGAEHLRRNTLSAT